MYVDVVHSFNIFISFHTYIIIITGICFPLFPFWSLVFRSFFFYLSETHIHNKCLLHTYVICIENIYV